MKPGGEKSVGFAGGWQYLIQRSGRGRVYWIVRQSMSEEDYSSKTQILGARLTLRAAETFAGLSMRRVRDAG